MTQLWTTAEYVARNGQDSNHIYTSNQLAIPHYSNGDGVNYLNNNGNHHYSTISPTFSAYSPQFIPGQTATGTLMYMSSSGTVPMSYHMQPPPSVTVPSQPRSLPHHQYYPPSIQNHRLTHQHTRQSVPEISLSDTEEQESPNDDSMRSEAIIPPVEGYPNVQDFDKLIKHYVENLSPKKQDKALIHAKRAVNIKAVLVDKKTTSVESAQFRFWVKKMFTLEPRDPSIPARKKKICHEGKPVAVREKLFKILIRAHKQCSHGGRDKTSAQVRRVYSWVPKELISRFVKLCPTCQVRRGTTRTSRCGSESSPGSFPQSPNQNSPYLSRRQSLASSMNTDTPTTTTMSNYLPDSTSARWMTPMHAMNKNIDRVATLEAAASAMGQMSVHSPISPETLTPAASKFADDPGTPYMSPNSIHDGVLSSQYHHHNSMHTMHNMHDISHSEHPYRIKRGSIYKRE